MLFLLLASVDSVRKPREAHGGCWLGEWDAWVAEGLKNGGCTGPFDQLRTGFYGGYMEAGT